MIQQTVTKLNHITLDFNLQHFPGLKELWKLTLWYVSIYRSDTGLKKSNHQHRLFYFNITNIIVLEPGAVWYWLTFVRGLLCYFFFLLSCWNVTATQVEKNHKVNQPAQQSQWLSKHLANIGWWATVLRSKKKNCVISSLSLFSSSLTLLLPTNLKPWTLKWMPACYVKRSQTAVSHTEGFDGVQPDVTDMFATSLS